VSISNRYHAAPVQTRKIFKRFSLAQRWEHFVLILSSTVLLVTGLPQKYRSAEWSQVILSSPERVELVQTIHHIAAVMLILEVVFHLGLAISLLTHRKLPGDIFPVWKDFKDAAKMIKYLLFMSREKPSYGKYNFEQKVTYWFIFFGVGIMVITGLILWFPIFFTRFLPGGVIPAAHLAHGSEAIVAAIFVVVWHFYHVHIERLNLSIFTGKMDEEEMKQYHAEEYQRVVTQNQKDAGGKS
jgi:formate dehydrogenase subunit gamma